MKISFMVTAFNKELYLNDAITSILGQKYDDFEIVIIDDHSTDGTQDVCMHYIEKNPDKIKYIRNSKNLGVGVSRNIAWENSTGDIICINDADDLSMIRRAEITAEAFAKRKDIDILYGSCVGINHNNERIGQREAESFSVAKLKKENFIQHPTVAFRRKVPIRYRDVRFIDDWYFYLDCVDAGLKFGYVSEVLGIYRVIHEGLTQDGGFYAKEKEKAKDVLRKEFEDFQEDLTEKMKIDEGQKTRVKAILKEIHKGSTVLDLACNGGYIMEQIKKKGCAVDGIEISNYLVKKCIAKGLNVFQGDILNLVYKPLVKYDVVLLGDILEHYNIENVVCIFNKAFELCGDNGKIIITVPYKHGRHSTRFNPDHVKDYGLDDFKMIMEGNCKISSKAILVGDNAVPDWLLITGVK